METHTTHFVALLSSELPAQAPDSFRLLPAGFFRAQDGRPKDIRAWQLTHEDMTRLVAEAQSRATDYPIDYEHQIIESKQNGQPAPAAGWFRALEARDDGLWAVNVRWTPRARQMIEAGEYRYISPVFQYDASGRVTRLLMAAITNHPALDGLTDLAPLTEELCMSDSTETLAALRQRLALPEGEDIAQAALTRIETLEEALASLQAESIPLTEHARLQGDLAALTARIEAGERARLLEQGLSDGRILPAQQDYWASQPLTALQRWLEVASPLAALTQAQSDARAGAGQGQKLTEEQASLCRVAGWSEEVFRADRA
ncbi:MAG: phage protease [Halothiobacillaceae bacterium]|nr:phage protease [Halothiobacillaceae bacterium]